MSDNKKIHIIGGGTVSHVRAHLALAAPAYGKTAMKIYEILDDQSMNFFAPLMMDYHLHLTRMAGGEVFSKMDETKVLETNDDVKQLVDTLVADNATKIIFFNPALVDFSGEINGSEVESGKYAERLRSRKTPPTGGMFSLMNNPDAVYSMALVPTDKIIGSIRKTRKDIFLVGFKTTCGETDKAQYVAGLNLLKEASCNLVLANDIKTRLNMIITPEEAAYHVTTDRDEALKQLVEMALLRSHLTFTRSTVVDGQQVSWFDDRVPHSLRIVVDHCIEKGAYKPFRGATVGHFAVKLDSNLFLTSKRKTNFNDLQNHSVGLVLVKTDGPDNVVAYGSKPSVGGQSQRIVFTDHPEADCIVHFHCPQKPGSQVPVVSQREFECGSHECGNNTSKGLQRFGNLKAVMLDQHGPNLVFHHSIDPREVIDFIEANFDLAGKTGGYMVNKGNIP